MNRFINWLLGKEKATQQPPKQDVTESQTSQPHPKPAPVKKKVAKILPAAEIGIGIDFGTSSTKVVLQDVGRRDKWALPYQVRGKKSYEYLFPTQLTVSNQGEFSFDGEGEVFRDIKLRFIGLFTEVDDPKGALDPEILVVGYLALILRKASRWFDREKAKFVRAKEIFWWLNIGLPAKNCDNAKMERDYRIAALAAWYTAEGDSSISISTAQGALSRAEAIIDVPDTCRGSRDDFGPSRISVIPEILAGIVGYTNSPFFKPGMYLLVDIGAATLDAAIFNLYDRSGMDRYSIFGTEVEPLGAVLYIKRLQQAARDKLTDIAGVDEAGQKRLKDLVQLNPYTDYLPKDFDRHGVAMNPNDPFMKESLRILTQLVYNAIYKKNPYATEWDSKLPVFITGGGRYIPFYPDLLRGVDDRLRHHHFNAFEHLDLDKPHDLDAPGLVPQEYHRMQIAYGLSYDPLTIGEIIPKSQIADIEKDEHVVDISDRYIGQEQV